MALRLGSRRVSTVRMRRRRQQATRLHSCEQVTLYSERRQMSWVFQSEELEEEEEPLSLLVHKRRAATTTRARIPSPIRAQTVSFSLVLGSCLFEASLSLPLPELFVLDISSIPRKEFQSSTLVRHTAPLRRRSYNAQSSRGVRSGKMMNVLTYAVK